MCKISLPHYVKCWENIRKSWAPLRWYCWGSCHGKLPLQGMLYLLHVCNTFAAYVHHEAVHMALQAAYPVPWRHCVSVLHIVLCIRWEKRLQERCPRPALQARFGFTFMSHPGTHREDENVQETRSENQPQRLEVRLCLQAPLPQRKAQLPPLPALWIALERGILRK